MITRQWFRLFIIMMGLAVWPVTTHAQEGKIPEIITNGLTVYKASGAEAALVEWLKGSPVEGQKDALSQSNILKQVETYYGPYKDYSLINIKDITDTAKIVYLQLNYENGPVFAYFVVYKKGGGGWIITSFQFHTEPMAILPPDYIS